MTNVNVTGYAMTLRLKSSASNQLQNSVYSLSPAGTWSSVPRLTVSSTVCLSLDVALNAGTYEVALLQWSAAAATVSTSYSKTVLLQSTEMEQDNEQSTEWASVRVEAAVDSSLQASFVDLSDWYYQFVITVSLVNASFSGAQNDMIVAFNNIYASDEPCSSKVGECCFRIFSVDNFSIVSFCTVTNFPNEKYLESFSSVPLFFVLSSPLKLYT